MRVMISGGFDPIHIGHVRYIKEAMNLGVELIVILNSDAWLVRKKGKFFMCEKDRKEIIESIVRPTDKVVIFRSHHNHVANAIRKFKPDIFAKGGDRDMNNIPIQEIFACRSAKTKILCGIGGNKIRSSQELLKKYEDA